MTTGQAWFVRWLQGLPPGVGRVRSNRVGRLKGYGNGLNAIQAATFIRAVMESTARVA